MTTTPRRVIRFGVLPPTVAIAELDRIPSGETIALYGNVGMARHSRCMKENYSTLFGLRTKILQTTQKNNDDDNNNDNRKITIASFSLENHCEEREEHSKWFHFCVDFLHTNPRTTIFEYNGGHQSSSITLDCANKFAKSLQSMSRSPNTLRTCVLRSSYTNVPAFQRVWDALLTTPTKIAVLKVSFHLHDTTDGNALEFSSLAHNTTLTQLEFSPEHRFGTNVLWDHFLAALHENTSLHTVHIFSLHVDPFLKKEISKQMKLNRIWNRYHNTMKKKKKIGTSPSSTSSSAIITNVTPPSSSSSSAAAAASPEAEAAINCNASRVLETRLLLDTFITKPRCRETIIFTRLRESFDVFDNDTNKETNYLYRMLRTMNATSLNNNKDDDITGISNTTDDPYDVSKDLKGNNNTTNTSTADNNDTSFWLTISENPVVKNCCVH